MVGGLKGIASSMNEITNCGGETKRSRNGGQVMTSLTGTTGYSTHQLCSNEMISKTMNGNFMTI
jgi:hypothetical protein